MFRYIVILFIMDVIGKLLWAIPYLRALAGLIFILWVTFLTLRKLFTPSNVSSSIFENKLMHALLWISYTLIFFLAIILFWEWSTQRLGITSTIHNIVSNLLISAAYIALCLIIIYFLSFTEMLMDLFPKWVNPFIRLSIIICFLLLATEAISSVLFYYSSFQAYNNHQIEEKIKKASEEHQSIKDLSENLINLKELKAISNNNFLTQALVLKNIYIAHKENVPQKLQEEIYKTGPLKNKTDTIPSLNVFLILFKFSFYQHYILALNDDLSDFQKYIASYLDTSSMQIIHMIFIRIIDLIIIGKVVELTPSLKKREINSKNIMAEKTTQQI